MKIIVKKRHKRKIKKANKFLSSINLGFYGIKAGFFGFVNQRQVETARLILTRLTKKFGRIFIRIHFFIGLTKKPLTSRMGKGIGLFKEWVVLIKKGNMLFEVSNVS